MLAVEAISSGFWPKWRNGLTVIKGDRDERTRKSLTLYLLAVRLAEDEP